MTDLIGMGATLARAPWVSCSSWVLVPPTASSEVQCLRVGTAHAESWLSTVVTRPPLPWNRFWTSALARARGLWNRGRCLGFVSLGERKAEYEENDFLLTTAEFAGEIPGGVIGTTALRLAWSPITRGGKTTALGSV